MVCIKWDNSHKKLSFYLPSCHFKPSANKAISVSSEDLGLNFSIYMDYFFNAFNNLGGNGL